MFQAAKERSDGERERRERLLHHPGQLRGAYSEVYRGIMRLRLVEDRRYGPISISEGGFFNPFIAYCASYRPCVDFPPSWSVDAMAGFLRRAGELVNYSIPGGARRMAAIMVIEYLLRLHRLAPFNVPPLVLPAYVEDDLPHLRRRSPMILKSIRTSNVRDWLRRRLRVQKGRPDRWVDKVNSKKGVREFTFDWMFSGPEEIGRACQTRSLRAAVAPRRLPVWHAPATLWRQCSARWSELTRRVRLPIWAFRRG